MNDLFENTPCAGMQIAPLKAQVMAREEFDALVSNAADAFKTELAYIDTNALVDAFDSGQLPVSVELQIEGSRVTAMHIFAGHYMRGWMLTVDETRLDDPAEWLNLAKVALELDAEATGRLIKIEDETGNVLIKDPTLLDAVSPKQSKVFDMSSDSPIFEVFQDELGFLLRSQLDKEEKTGHSAHLTEAEWAQLESQLYEVKSKEEIQTLDFDVRFDAEVDKYRKTHHNIHLMSEVLMRAHGLGL